jgi:hypothetical protein
VIGKYPRKRAIQYEVVNDGVHLSMSVANMNDLAHPATVTASVVSDQLTLKHIAWFSVAEILQCAYNFIRPRARLQLGTQPRTPAMLAGVFARVLSWRSVFGWPLPPPTPATVLRRATDPTVRLTSWRVRRWQRRD